MVSVADSSSASAAAAAAGAGAQTKAEQVEASRVLNAQLEAAAARPPARLRVAGRESDSGSVVLDLVLDLGGEGTMLPPDYEQVRFLPPPLASPSLRSAPSADTFSPFAGDRARLTPDARAQPARPAACSLDPPGHTPSPARRTAHSARTPSASVQSLSSPSWLLRARAPQHPLSPFIDARAVPNLALPFRSPTPPTRSQKVSCLPPSLPSRALPPVLSRQRPDSPDSSLMTPLALLSLCIPPPAGDLRPLEFFGARCRRFARMSLRVRRGGEGHAYAQTSDRHSPGTRIALAHPREPPSPPPPPPPSPSPPPASSARSRSSSAPTRARFARISSACAKSAARACPPPLSSTPS